MSIGEAKARRAKKRWFGANLRPGYLYREKYTNRSATVLDLIREGNIGLMKAVDKFGIPSLVISSRPMPLWWIRQAITRSITDRSAVTIHISGAYD